MGVLGQEQYFSQKLHVIKQKPKCQVWDIPLFELLVRENQHGLFHQNMMIGPCYERSHTFWLKDMETSS